MHPAGLARSQLSKYTVTSSSSNVLPRPGEILRLRLNQWNGYPQVVIDAARVRTKEKQEVGLEVLRIQDGEKGKLRQVVETLLRHHQEY